MIILIMTWPQRDVRECDELCRHLIIENISRANLPPQPLVGAYVVKELRSSSSACQNNDGHVPPWNAANCYVGRRGGMDQVSDCKPISFPRPILVAVAPMMYIRHI